MKEKGWDEIGRGELRLLGKKRGTQVGKGNEGKMKWKHVEHEGESEQSSEGRTERMRKGDGILRQRMNKGRESGKILLKLQFCETIHFLLNHKRSH